MAVTKSSITFSPCRAPYAEYCTAMSGRLLSPSSPVFCTAKYRGGVRRTEGLKNCDSNSNKIKSQPLPCRVPQHCGALQNNIGKKTALQSSSPVFCTAKYRGGVRRTEGLKNCDSNSNKIKSQPLSLPYPAALRGVAQRYRGSTRRARGLKQKQKNEKIESAMSRGKRLKETF